MVTPNDSNQSALWEDLIPILVDHPDSLQESFSKAVNAVVESRQQGHITDEEVNVLFRELVGVLVGALVSARVENVVMRALSGSNTDANLGS